MKMTFESLFCKNLIEHNALFSDLYDMQGLVSRASRMIYESLNSGGKLLICGNGGSAADSQHLAAEMTGRFSKNRKPIAAIALSTDTSTITCIANDYSFSEIFSRQITAIGASADVLLAISTSGNSENIKNAIFSAREIGMKVIVLAGKGGGVVKDMSDLALIVPSNNTARIQEAHIMIGHTICGDVEIQLGLV